MSESIRVLDAQAFSRLRAGLLRFQVIGLETLEIARAKSRFHLEELVAAKRQSDHEVAELEKALVAVCQREGAERADDVQRLERAKKSAGAWAKHVDLYRRRLELFESQAREFRLCLDREIPGADGFLARAECGIREYLQRGFGPPQGPPGEPAVVSDEPPSRGLLGTMLSFLLGLFVPPLIALQIGPLSISIGITGISIGLPLAEVGEFEFGVNIALSPNWDRDAEYGWQIEACPLVSAPFIPA